MDMSSFAAAGFIRPDHLTGTERVVIKAIEKGQFKPVAVLGDARKLGLNGTTIATLIRAFGKDSDGWINKTIEIRPGTTTFNGASKATVLVSVPPSAPRPPVQSVAQSPAGNGPQQRDDMGGDDIPF
jgi:hypothetical protein